MCSSDRPPPLLVARKGDSATIPPDRVRDSLVAIDSTQIPTASSAPTSGRVTPWLQSVEIFISWNIEYICVSGRLDAFFDLLTRTHTPQGRVGRQCCVCLWSRVFFFLMIRRRPGSTLLPDPTLFRSGQRRRHLCQRRCHMGQIPCHIGQRRCHIGQIRCHMGQIRCHTDQIQCQMGQR